MVDPVDVLFSTDASFISLLLLVEIKISADFKKLNVLPTGAVIVSISSCKVTSFTRLGAVLLLLNSGLLLVVTSGVPISKGRFNGDELSTLKFTWCLILKLMPFFLQEKRAEVQSNNKTKCFMGVGFFYWNVVRNISIAQLNSLVDGIAAINPIFLYRYNLRTKNDSGSMIGC